MRNDEDIERDITEELEFDPAIDPSRIRVTARDGVVSLSGFVPGYTQKYLAESAAKRVYGVRAVGDELHVELPRAGERPDTVIAEAVLCRLRWDTSVPADSIQITVDEGRVTLEGTVEWTHQRAAAERAVRGLTGVRSVRNLIQVRPIETVSADDVRRRIVEAFGRSAALGARAIKVEANDQRVVLTGNVRSWTEADTAEHVAPECPVCQKWATSLP